jgi:hypothetical protein
LLGHRPTWEYIPYGDPNGFRIGIHVGIGIRIGIGIGIGIDIGIGIGVSIGIGIGIGIGRYRHRYRNRNARIAITLDSTIYIVSTISLIHIRIQVAYRIDVVQNLSAQRAAVAAHCGPEVEAVELLVLIKVAAAECQEGGVEIRNVYEA